MAFVCLADLFDPVADELLPLLPGPQRRALEVVLLRADAVAEVDFRAVGSGVCSLLVHLSVRSPILIAIDDVQWVDRASAAALAFALRRLRDQPTGVAVTLRDPGKAPDPLGLAPAFAHRLIRLRLGPLDSGAMARVVAQQLQPLSPSVLQHVHQTAGGNPLLALEVARALIEAGVRPAPADPLPVPPTITALVARRVTSLPSSTREALLVAACLSTPTLALTQHVVGPQAMAAFERAAAAGLIELHGQRLVFLHPLFASAIMEMASPAERRSLHRRLGDLVSDVDERARHLALAANGPDAPAAALLDAAADRARSRGAPGVAGELLKWAAGLTPPTDREVQQSRIIAAAEHFFRAGDLAYARSLLEEITDRVRQTEQHGAVLRLLGQIRYNDDSFEAAVPLLTRALASTHHAPAAVEILLELTFAHFSIGDLPRALDAAREAVERAVQARLRPVIAEALAVEANVRFFAGLGADTQQLARAVADEDPARNVPIIVRPSTISALFCVYLGQLSDGADALRALRRRALNRGEEADCMMLLLWLGRTETWRGALDQAEQIANEAMGMAEQAGSDTYRAAALLLHGHLQAVRGETETARHGLEASRSLLDDAGWSQVVVWNRAALGFLEVSVGAHAAAVHTFTPYLAPVELSGVPEPFGVNFLPDAIEALIGDDQVERAERVLDVFEERARTLGRAMAIMGAARCRALLLARHGALSQAREAIGESLQWTSAGEFPLEHGRSLLVHGQLLRRSRKKQAARAVLEQALEVFEPLGARLWADRALTELDRVGHGSSPGVLTPTEQRVAELAAAGSTNRRIAGALFISPKTVEANLSHVYRKLDISSRAELGAVMAKRSVDPG